MQWPYDDDSFSVADFVNSQLAELSKRQVERGAAEDSEVLGISSIASVPGITCTCSQQSISELLSQLHSLSKDVNSSIDQASEDLMNGLPKYFSDLRALSGHLVLNSTGDSHIQSGL